MKLTITLKLHDGDGDGATLVPTIDGVAHEIVHEPLIALEAGRRLRTLKMLPRPRPWWKLSALDVAVFSGTVAGFVWLLS